MADRHINKLLRTIDSAEKAALIAELILENLPPTIAEVARYCSILHWFDQDIISNFVSTDFSQDTGKVYDVLAALPFIEILPGALGYNELTRQGLVKYYSQTKPQLIKTATRLAAPSYLSKGYDKAIAEAFFCYIIAGEYETAAGVFDQMLDAYKGGYKWQYLSGVLQIQAEAEALSFVQQLVRTSSYWRANGIIHQAQSDLTSAIVAYTRAIELDPYQTINFYYRATAQLGLGNLYAAISDFSETIRLDQNFAEAYLMRGLTLYNLGDLSAATADLNKSIEIAPNSAEAHRIRELAYQPPDDSVIGPNLFPRTRLRSKKSKKYPLRLTVYRSTKHIYAQVIDDRLGHTLAEASTVEPKVRMQVFGQRKVVQSQEVGNLIAERALGKGVTKVALDIGKYKYHGRVRALAESALNAGLLLEPTILSRGHSKTK